MVKDRVDRLMVYASHAALAIRHAQLYGEMAQEVEARTGQLGRQNREQEALLDINRAVQEMRGAPDLERVARVCYEQLKALKMDFQGLAIQRLMDEDEADFEIFELRTSGRFSRWRSPSPNLLRIWSAGKIDYRKDMDRDLQGHSAEPLALVRERYGLDIRCVLDVPHARGTLALLSTTPNAFSDSEISFTERVAEVLSVGLARLGDLQQVEASREAQAESQRYAQRIADAIPSVLYVYDLSEQRLSYVNDQVSRVLGYSAKAVQELGAGVVELLHPEDRDPVVEHLERLGEADDAEVFDIDYRMRHANGEWRWLRSRDVIFARGPDGSARQLLGTALDITERRAAATRLARYQGQLRSLSSELTLTEERERRRIATDLHDEIGQILAVTKIKLGALQATPTATDLGEALSEVRGLIDRAIQEARSLTFDLSLPVLYELGFEAALEWLVEQVQSEFGLQVRHSDDGEPKPLDDDVKVLVFRAVRELLYNAAKHAKVSEVQLTTRRVDSQLRIEVLDHGVGFDTEAYAVDVAEGFGLFSIRERLSFMGGEFLIESEPGQGTRAVLAAPMKGYVPPTDRENA
jgi:PAS domain S-box-containing protein